MLQRHLAKGRARSYPFSASNLAERPASRRGMPDEPRRSAASVAQPDEMHLTLDSTTERDKVAHMRLSSIVRFVRDNLPDVLLSLVVAFAVLGIMALTY